MANVIQEFNVPSGHTVRKVIRCARQGTIGSCRLVQWDDDKALFDGFEFEFFASKEACPPGVVANDSEEAKVDGWDRVQHIIGQRKTAEKGKDEPLKDDKPDTEAGWQYRNYDNGGSQTNMMRQVYLELKDNGPVEWERVKTYKLFLDVEAKGV